MCTQSWMRIKNEMSSSKWREFPLSKIQACISVYWCISFCIYMCMSERVNKPAALFKLCTHNIITIHIYVYCETSNSLDEGNLVIPRGQDVGFFSSRAFLYKFLSNFENYHKLKPTAQAAITFWWASFNYKFIQLNKF